MRFFIDASILLAFSIMIMTCGGGTVVVESTPRPESATGVEPLSVPQQSFQIPTPKDEWTPVTIGSGSGEALARALSDRNTVALILPRNRKTPALEDQVFQMIKAAAPKTKVVARGKAILDQLLEERGEIPYRVTLQPAGTDILGRPTYLPKEHPLNTDWLERKSLLKGAEAILAVRPIRVDDSRLRELRKGRQGGCAAFEKALLNGITRAPAFFKDYETKANLALSAAFVRHLDVALPFWRTEMRNAARNVAPGDIGSRCLDAYRSVVDTYKPCLDGACRNGPNLYMVGGGVIGMITNDLLVPKECPLEGMRDYAAEIKDLAVRAVKEVLPALEGGWVSELIRYGGLAELENTIKEGCTPRHRRLQPDVLSAVRKEVTDYLTDLGQQDLQGVWEPARGMERAPGIGPVQLLARVRSSGGDPVEGAKKLSERLKSIDRCDNRQERLFQAVLVDVGTSEVLFMGIFFEEELLCSGLPPGSP